MVDAATTSGLGSGSGRSSGPSWTTIIVFVVVIEAIGFAVGSSFGPEPGGWYFQLEKSALNPPPWVFPVAWTLLYAMIGWAAARVWALPATAARTTALALFAVQLALNYLWSYVFFGLQALQPAVWMTVALLVAVVAATIAFFRVDRLSGLLMSPYLIWVGFALFLTYEVARLNT